MQRSFQFNIPNSWQTGGVGWRSRCTPQLPLNCWRGRGTTSAPRTLSCNSSRPIFGSNEEEEEGSRLEGSGAGWSALESGRQALGPSSEGEPVLPSVSADDALSGLATERLDSTLGTESPSLRPTHLTRAASVFSPAEHVPGQGWYECNLFDVLQDAHIDAQSASHFFSQLAMHDSWASPLPVADLVTAARIADITGFALPPIVAAQLQEMVMSAGPVAASASAEPLLAAFGYDLPVLLDVLYGIDVRPSHAWTDYVLRSWLAGGPPVAGESEESHHQNQHNGKSSDLNDSVGGAGRRGGVVRSPNLTAASVRVVVQLLEAIYMPDAESWLEPAPVLPPQSAPVVAAAAPLHAVNNDTWRPTTGTPSAVADGDDGGAAAAAAAATPSASASVGASSGPYDKATVASHEAAHVRTWLDACIAALLAIGALARPHQREDLYGMLPQLATAPSAAMVERLYAEAPPPYAAVAAGANAGDDGSDAWTASPEHLAALLWLFAKSGAKLPPSVIQRELRALEEAILRYASLSVDQGPMGSDGSSRKPMRPGHPTGRGGRSDADAAPAGGAIAAAAAAALNAAFALPTSPGASTPASSLQPQSQPSPAAAPFPSPPYSSSSPSSSVVPPFPSILSTASNPPSTPPPPPPSPPLYPPSFSFPLYPSNSSHTSSAAAKQRLSGRGAYLCFWALHHYRHAPHAAAAPGVAATLLAAVLGGVRELGAQQRCRVLRSLLLCFDPDTVHPRLLASYDWSPLFAGWEALRAHELLPLLCDVATLSRLRQRRRTAAAAAGNGGGVQLQLSHLAAHVVQLVGWPRRLEGVELTTATGSITSLLAILEDVGDRSSGDSSDGGGGGIVRSVFAQGLLSSWLTCVLPVIQERVKLATGDWGSSALAGRSHRLDRTRPSQQQPPQQPFRNSYYDFERDTYDNGASNPGGGRGAAHAEPARVTSSLAVKATTSTSSSSSAAAADPEERAGPWLTPLTPPAAPPLTAVEVTAALMSLRDAAAALDAAAHPKLHRALMWAVQRLGSRAGRWLPGPDVFGRVPDLLLQLEALAWVDVPTEWAETVVRHPDPEATWFRSLPWTDALRAVLVSGELLQRARAEMLRSHGAAITPEPTGLSYRDVVHTSLEPASLDGGGLGGTRDGSVATSSIVVPSKAQALLNATLRLRNHLVGLLAARTASGGPAELRQLALTWQVYGMPYDREALAAVLGALQQIEQVEEELQEQVGREARRRQLQDAVQRLELMCTAQQAPAEEMERLFAAIRRPPLPPSPPPLASSA